MAVDIQQARAALEQRCAREQAKLDLRFTEAWQDFRAVLEMLISKYRPRRIHQWGSLLDRQKFWRHSDIDIAVEGILDPAEFFALYGDADRLTRFSLDLVALERIEPEFADLIRQKGIVVYDREQSCAGPHCRG